MPAYHIPRQFVPGFQTLTQLSDDEAKMLAEILHNLVLGTGPQSFAKTVAERLPGRETSGLASAVYSLGQLLQVAEGSEAELANNIAEGLLQTPEFREADRAALSARLLPLLQNGGALKHTFRAFGLMASNERLYREGRVITDIRLLFNDNLTIVPRQAMIVHQLRIEWQHNDEEEAFFITMDRSDLAALKSQLERALEKEQQIQASYADTLPLITFTT